MRANRGDFNKTGLGQTRWKEGHMQVSSRAGFNADSTALADQSGLGLLGPCSRSQDSGSTSPLAVWDPGSRWVIGAAAAAWPCCP